MRPIRIATLAAIVALVAAAGLWVTRADSATAIAALDALSVPAPWLPAASERERPFLAPSRETRFYLVPGTVTTVTVDASAMLAASEASAAGPSLPACQANSGPIPQVVCVMGVRLRSPLDRIDVTIFDLPAALEVLHAPWLTGAQAGDVVVRVTVSY
jgi:hypothetical protein